MKKKLWTILLTLVLALSVFVGIFIIAGAEGEGDAGEQTGANIIYNFAGVSTSVPYQYGVDNYLSYMPTAIPSGKIFAGWYYDEELNTPANVIPAGTTGDVNIYGKLLGNPYLVSESGQAVNNRLTSNEFSGKENSTEGLSYTVNADGSVTYKNLNGDTSLNGYGYFFTSNGASLGTHLNNHTGESKIYKLTIELGIVPGMQVLPFAFNGSNGWNLLVTGVPHSDGKYYVYLSGTGDDRRIAELPADGSLVTVSMYLDLSVNGKANYYAYNISGQLKTYQSNFTGQGSAQLGRVLIGQQVTNATSSYKPSSYPAGITIGSFNMTATDDDGNLLAPVIVDSYGDLVKKYTAFEATALPTEYDSPNDELVFDGWYADAEFTQLITSIPAGYSARLTVYPKYVLSAEGADDLALAAEMQALLTAFAGKDFGSRTALFADVLSIQPNTSHPRLYVNAATLANVKADLADAENIDIYTALLLDARLALQKTGTPTTASELKASLTDAENLAFAYLVTGKAKYGYKAVYYILNYIDQIEGSSLNALQAAYDASTAINVTGEVYDWCYGLLTAEQRSQIINGICCIVAKDCENTGGNNYGYPPSGSEIISGHGAERLVMRDWLAFAVAVADEAPDIYNYIAGRVVNEYTKMPNWYYVSNDVHQGTAYGTVARLFPNIAADMMMYSATGERIFSENIDFAEVIMSSIYKMRPDDESLRIGDDYNQTGSKYGTGNIAIMAFYAGNYYGNATAKAWYEYLGSPIPTTTGEMSRVMYLLINDPSVTVGDDDLYNLSLIRYNGSPAGSMIARSAWGDENAWMTYTNIEEAGANNHDHKDSGTFQIYYKGILAPNAGQYEHNGQNYHSNLHISYTKQTISKNGLLIYNPNLVELYGKWTNSGGQRVESAVDVNAPYSFEEYRSSDLANQATVLGQDGAVNADGSFKYAYISGDITNSYYEGTVDLVMRSTMTLATGDPDHPMAFIVYDRITSDDASYKKSFVLHTMEEPTFNGGSEVSAPAGEDAAFTYISGSNSFYYTNVLGPTGAYAQDDLNDKYNGKLTTTTLLPENPVYRYIGGDGKRFWVNGVNGGNSSVTENPTRHPVGEIGWGRVEISPSASQLTDSFLNVMYVGDAKDAQGNATSNTLAPSTLVQCDTHEGAVTFGNVVMFSKTNAPITSAVTFTAEGAGNMTYYVGGLAAGAWTVLVNNAIACEYTVDAESGLLTFAAEAGADIKLLPYLIESYDISYETNGGAINDAAYSTRFFTGGAVTLPQNVERYGYTFDGWYENSELTALATEASISTKVSGITLYAKWIKTSADIIYKVDNITVNTSDYIYGVETPVDYTPIKADHLFIGWYSDTAFTTEVTVIPADATGDKTLYAKFVSDKILANDDFNSLITSYYSSRVDTTDTTGLKITEGDGYVDYVYQDAAGYAPRNFVPALDTSDGSATLWDKIQRIRAAGVEAPVVKVTVQFTKTSSYGMSFLMLTNNLHYNSGGNRAMLNMGVTDSLAYFYGQGANAAGRVQTAEIISGEMVEVTFYMDLSSINESNYNTPTSIKTYVYDRWGALQECSAVIQASSANLLNFRFAYNGSASSTQVPATLRLGDTSVRWVNGIPTE